MNIVTLKQKKDLLVSVFGEGITSGDGKDLAVYCPVCKKSPKTKKKRKLSISIETGVYHCWVCESKGKSLSWFVKKNIPEFKNLDRVREFFGGENSPDEDEKKVICLPSDFKMVVLSNSHTANFIREYLFNRGMQEEDLYRFKVGYSFEYGFKNRVIFPSLDSNLDLNFYVTRTVEEETKFAKYKNCDASKKDIIFNEHLVNWKKPIVLVEGIFDAVKSGKQSVPVLGSWVDMSYAVFRKIVENKTPVILGFDPDAKHKEIKIAKLFYQNGIDVKTINNFDKDLGGYTREEVKNLILDAKPFDNMERMRYLISRIKSGSMY
jgi:hypothetical protein